MLTQQERAEILRLSEFRLSVPQISQKIGRSTTTIYRTLSRKNSQIQQKEIKEIRPPKRLAGFIDYIRKRKRSGVTNCQKLFDELKEQGYKGSYASLYGYIRVQNENRKLRELKPSKGFETVPGNQAQVDWGYIQKIKIRGRTERLYCFVYVLGYSRAKYAEFTTTQSLQALEECHINAFEKLGIPENIVYDNMKTVVLWRERQDDGNTIINFNPSFLEFAHFYTFNPQATAPYWPRAKGKVEAGVKYIKGNFMQGVNLRKNFDSLADLNEELQKWLNNTANVKENYMTKEKPLEKWLKEKSHLRFPKKGQRYITAPLETRISTQASSIQFENNFYSIPCEFARKGVQARKVLDNGVAILEIYHEGKLITTHTVSKEQGKFVSKDEHFILRSERKKSKSNNRVKLKKLNKKLTQVATRPLSYYNHAIPGYKEAS